MKSVYLLFFPISGYQRRWSDCADASLPLLFACNKARGPNRHIFSEKALGIQIINVGKEIKSVSREATEFFALGGVCHQRLISQTVSNKNGDTLQ